MGFLGHINTLLDVVTLLLQNMNDIDDLPVAADVMIRFFKIHMNIIDNKAAVPLNEGKYQVEAMLRVITFLIENVTPLNNLTSGIILKYFRIHMDTIDSKLNLFPSSDEVNLLDTNTNDYDKTDDPQNFKMEDDQYKDRYKDEEFSEIKFPDVVDSKAIEMDKTEINAKGIDTSIIHSSYAGEVENSVKINIPEVLNETDRSYQKEGDRNTKNKDIESDIKNNGDNDDDNLNVPIKPKKQISVEDFFSCIFCDEDFSANHILKHDKDKHMTKDNFYKCQDCEEISVDKKEIVIHFASKHKYIPYYNCINCNDVFFDRRTMRKHMKYSHQILLKTEDCPICLEPQKHAKVREHMEKIHSTVKLRCNHCGIFKNSTELLRGHIKYQHSLEKEFITCYICGKRGLALHHEKHMEVHLATERKYECPICLKKFFTSNQLFKHKGLHQPKRHKCKECDFKSHKADNLKRHMMIHSDTYPFPCTYCERKFKFKNLLKDHTKLHTGEKDIKCNYCDKMFRRSGSRSKHEKIHTKTYKARCEECRKDFVQKCNYFSHMRKHHSVKADDQRNLM